MEAAFVRCLSQLTVRSPGCLRGTPPTAKRISHRATPRTQLRFKPSNHSRTFATAPTLLQDERTADSSPLSSRSPPPQSISDATATTNPSQSVSQASQPPSSTSPAPPQPPSSKPLTTDETVAKHMDSIFARHISKASSSATRQRSNYDYYGANASSTSNPLMPRSGNTDVLSFLPPASNQNTDSSNRSASNAGLNAILTEKFYSNAPTKAEAPLRLKPTLGKTVEVTNSFGLNRAFPTLETKINKNGNSVKMDLINQRFHVRRGMKKKVYKRIRGRQMFMEGFLGECARVRRMIKQGW